MAREYQKRPSEMVGISDEYLAYCFDEVAFYLLAEAMDKEGKLNWKRIKWVTDKPQSNTDLMEFMKKHG